MKQQAINSPILTMREAAEFLRISLRTLANWVKRGLVRSMKLGNRRLFHRDELLEDLKRIQNMEV